MMIFFLILSVLGCTLQNLRQKTATVNKRYTRKTLQFCLCTFSIQCDWISTLCENKFQNAIYKFRYFNYFCLPVAFANYTFFPILLILGCPLRVLGCNRIHPEFFSSFASFWHWPILSFSNVVEFGVHSTGAGTLYYTSRFSSFLCIPVASANINMFYFCQFWEALYKFWIAILLL